MRSLALALALGIPAVALGHGATGSEAPLITPAKIERADREYRFVWTDADMPTPLGKATIDFYYTAKRPRTYFRGTLPPDLAGAPIVTGIEEPDLENTYTWDTSSVATGAYWLFSRVREPRGEIVTATTAAISKGLVVVHHPGDAVPCAVRFTNPDTTFEYAEDDRYDLGVEALDPDGSGRIALEAAHFTTPDVSVEIARDLPVPGDGALTHRWDTTGFAEGWWLVRATLVDARGCAFVAYGPYFVFVVHFLPDAGVELDAGVLPEAGVDAGVRDAGAADAAGPVPAPGCGCRSASGSDPLALLAGLAALGRRRRSGWEWRAG